MRSNNTRIRRLVCAAALALTALAAPAANAATAAGNDPVAKGAFVPGVTDFPSRLGEAGERAAEQRLAQRSLDGVSVFVQTKASGFDWSAATTGALAATLLLLGAALAVRVGRRNSVAVG
jgi:hypothetical protein